MKAAIVGLLLISSPPAFEADPLEANGKIIYDEKRWKSVVFLLPPYRRSTLVAYDQIQDEITYRDDNGDHHILLPDMAKEVRFIYNADTVRLISNVYKPGAKTLKNIFLKLSMEGNLNVFEYFEPGRGSSTLVFQKGEGELLFCGPIVAFKRKMTPYFSDCPALADIISHGDFGKEDLLQIAIYYNTRCKQD